MAVSGARVVGDAKTHPSPSPERSVGQHNARKQNWLVTDPEDEGWLSVTKRETQRWIEHQQVNGGPAAICQRPARHGNNRICLTKQLKSTFHDRMGLGTGYQVPATPAPSPRACANRRLLGASSHRPSAFLLTPPPHTHNSCSVVQCPHFGTDQIVLRCSGNGVSAAAAPAPNLEPRPSNQPPARSAGPLHFLTLGACANVP